MPKVLTFITGIRPIAELDMPSGTSPSIFVAANDFVEKNYCTSQMNFLTARKSGRVHAVIYIITALFLENSLNRHVSGDTEHMMGSESPSKYGSSKDFPMALVD